MRFRFLFLPRNLKNKVSIRIDISLRERPTFREQSVLIPFDYPISPYPLVVHLTKEELLSEKIRALFARKKARDLFDIWFLLTKKTKINEKLIKKKFNLYPSLIFSLPKLRKVILEFEEKEIKKDLNQFLPQNYRDFYKHLKEEVLKLIP